MDLFGRLSDYDIFAYVPPGALALAAADYVIGGDYLLKNEWNVFEGFVFVILAYVVGHLVSSLASAVVERWLVRKVLQQPSKVLLRTKRPGFLVRMIFADYMTPISEPLRSKVVGLLGGLDPDSASAEELFWCAYPTASRDAQTKERLDSFLNLYGFCRNLSFVFGCISIWLTLQGIGYWGRHASHPSNLWPMAILTLVVSLMLFYRYLKFHRLYGLEVFKTFAALKATPPDRLDKADR